ncbi:MAG: 30S ribosomal protein S16 [bacterium]|nr:30S ribosomal protein S16 [bacterium]
MVKVRLYRTGAKKRPSYRIVAIDSRKKRQGRVLELLGTYDPIKDSAVVLRQEALDRWIGKGAQLSDTVASLIRRKKREEAAAETGA